MWWAQLLNNIAALLGVGGGETNSYESIQTYTVGAGGSSSISFTSIPSTYKHLQIRAIARSTRSNVNDNIYMGFNADTTTSNYNAHWLVGDGSSASASQLSGVQTAICSINAAGTAGSNIFSAVVIDVLDYASANKNKTGRTLSGYDNNGSGVVGIFSELWMNTTAINSIQFTSFYGNFAQYSSFALYGIKG